MESPPSTGITQDDINAMLAQNPMAREQILRIAAERREGELTEELSLLRNGHEPVGALEATDGNDD
jgi:hypothetical protein